MQTAHGDTDVGWYCYKPPPDSCQLKGANMEHRLFSVKVDKFDDRDAINREADEADEDAGQIIAPVFTAAGTTRVREDFTQNCTDRGYRAHLVSIRNVIIVNMLRGYGVKMGAIWQIRGLVEKKGRAILPPLSQSSCLLGYYWLVFGILH